MSVRATGLYSQLWVRFRRNRIALVGLGLVAVYVTVATLIPAIPFFQPTFMHAGAELAPPSRAHPFGTDQFGRDILSRVLYGIRVSLAVSVVATALAATAGVFTGVIAGYTTGWVSSVVMRVYDVLMSFPAILLAIAIAATTGTGAFNASVALAIVGMPRFGRVTRAGVLVEKSKEYVLASESVGAKPSRLMFRHILPNVAGPIFAQISLFMASAILLEAGLSFLGLGVPPPQPSLGSMLTEARPFMAQAYWYAVAPGAALTLLIFAMNALGDGLRDVFDPRLFR